MMKVGKRVRIKRKKSVKHFQAANMPITGTITAVDDTHFDGYTNRPILVRFDDGRETWWQRKELAEL